MPASTRREPWSEPPARRSYAVVWSDEHDVHSGRLEPHSDRFELCGLERRSIPFAEVTGASIARSRADRLRGLPVLALRTGASAFCIASLEGAGVLHELVAIVERAGLSVVA
jgi:hypothetical protein